jgi:hypothetical protein
MTKDKPNFIECLKYDSYIVIGWSIIIWVFSILFNLIHHSWTIEDFIFSPVAAFFIAIIFVYLLQVFRFSKLISIGSNIGHIIVNKISSYIY